ncbi:MAG: DUF4974 domain-containing protein [Bacteroidales bacterium]|nr:DUF4974 domain-containing protein [Bacteroidales bacterium]
MDKKTHILSAEELLEDLGFENFSLSEESCEFSDDNIEDIYELKEKIEVLSKASNMINDLEYFQADKAFAKVEKRISDDNRKKFFTKAMFSIAAILTIPLLIGGFLLLNFNKSGNDTTVVMQRVSSVKGTITSFILPDSSQVWLNSESTISFPSSFDENERIVNLDGEAYFKVKADNNHPFKVVTPKNNIVTALGTEFNVCAYSDDSEEEAFLVKGNINYLLNNKSFNVQPGDKYHFDSSTNLVSKETIALNDAASWKQGKLIFKNTPLDKVVKKLSRHYSVDISIKDEKLKNYKYTATFSNENLIQIFQMLQISTPDLSWSRTEISKNEDGTYSTETYVLMLK